MIDLDFEIYVFSMELQSFEKPYAALLNSAKRAYEQPIYNVNLAYQMFDLNSPPPN